MRTLIVIVLCIATSLPAYAQAGTFAGTVASDTAGNVVGHADVQLPQLSRATTTNIVGQFQFNDVPPGRYAVVVRAIGFQLFADSVDIAPGARVDGDIVLTPTVVSLETQHTTAAALEKRLPPGIQEMNDRMKTHLGGHFVTDSVLRANDQRKLTYFFAGIPGVHQIFASMGTGVYLASARDPKPPPCYIDVYMNGALYYRNGDKSEPPDFSALTAMDFSGIEFYPGGATTPAQYNGTKKRDCGVILLWTRR